jgi:hypothetical protein
MDVKGFREGDANVLLSNYKRARLRATRTFPEISVAIIPVIKAHEFLPPAPPDPTTICR